MTITKAHLIASIRNRLDLPKSESEKIIKSLFENINETLENGQDILISGFGKFSIKDNKDRRGRSLSTRESMMLDSTRIVTLKCSPVLRDKLNRKG